MEMQKKFVDLFYAFHPEPAPPGCLPDQLVFRGAADIPGAVMNSAYMVVTEPVLMKAEPHYHNDADEYLAILGGTLPDVFASWDAEVHFYMGPTLDTMEKVVITEPTMVKVPRGWWHCPLNFVRVDKPIFFLPAILGQNADLVKQVAVNGSPMRMVFSEGCDAEAKFSSVPWTVVNEDGVLSYTDKGAYDDTKAPSGEDSVLMPGVVSKPYGDTCVLKAPKPALSEELRGKILAMPREMTGWGDWCPCPQAYFRGQTYMAEATYDIGFQLYCNTVDAEVTHFHSSGEEYIFFMGADPKNPMDFDAEIEMTIGEDSEHLESKLITSPTVVRLPPNTWHAPIKFRKVNKPVLFQAAYLAGTWGVIHRVKDREDGDANRGPHSRKQVYEYMGNDTRLCIHDPNRRCNLCGMCFKKMKKPE